MNINWITQWQGLEGWVVVWCDARKLDDNWRWSTDQYVAPYLVNKWHGVDSRYEDHAKRLPAGLPCDIADGGFADIDIVEAAGGGRAVYAQATRPPEVICFGDGRHRVRWCIDHGVEAVPMYFRPKPARLARSLFGTNLRASVLPSNYVQIGQDGMAAAKAKPPTPKIAVTPIASPANCIDTSLIPPADRTWFEKLFARWESRP